MKNNVTTSEDFMGGKVIEFVSFLANWVANKNTTFGSRSEFMRDMNISSICKTPENSKMRIRRDLPMKPFKRSFSRKKWCGQTINEMNGSENTVCPERQKEIGLKVKGSS